MTAAALVSEWLGPVHSEARAGFRRAREAGLSPMRALVIGHVASFKECWTFRKNIAVKVGCSIRTVQRALTQAKAEGLIGTARAKKDDIPPKWEHGPIPCGWSHRWVVGWGKAGKMVADAVHAAKARWLVKHAAPQRVPRPATEIGAPRTYKPTARPEYQRRSWTAAELDAELDRLLPATRPPPE